MSRRLHAAYGNHVSVVNEGIGGDTAAVPPVLPLRQVLPQRFNRDILGVSGITNVIFYAGTNDFGDGVPAVQSIASLTSMAGILHSHGIKAIGATLISNIGQAGTTQATYDAHNAINTFILTSGVFDSTADFYTVTADPVTKILLPQYATHSDPNGTPASCMSDAPVRKRKLAPWMSISSRPKIIGPCVLVPASTNEQSETTVTRSRKGRRSLDFPRDRLPILQFPNSDS
jgi:hypothetical protein